MSYHEYQESMTGDDIAAAWQQWEDDQVASMVDDAPWWHRLTLKLLYLSRGEVKRDQWEGI